MNVEFLNIFITVNYGSSALLVQWAKNIRMQCSDTVLIVVDNFKNENERLKVINITKLYDIILIESDNIGYGAALNKGISYAMDRFSEKNLIFFAGNLDIIYKNIPKKYPIGRYVYIPIIKEGKRNRNPFLTKLQKKILPIYRIAGLTQSLYVYYLVVIINKIIGLIPYKIWAIHGSLFCFNSLAIKEYKNIFNDNSFLYVEELEFASYMESNNIEFINSNIEIEHHAHISTKDIIAKRKIYLSIWWSSYKNWLIRWGY